MSEATIAGATAPQVTSRSAQTALLMALIYGVSLLFGAHFLNDPDTYWHIKTGLDILETGAFPKIDPYSHSWAGEPWIAKEWASQVIIAAAYSLGGWNGVVVVSALAIAATGGVMFWLLTGHIRPMIAAPLVIACLYLSSWTLLARPHIFALPLMLIFVNGVWSAAQETRAPKFWLLGVMFLWANLHGSFTAGYVFAIIAVAQFLIGGGRGKDALVNRWVLFLGLLPIVSIIHPYGYESIWSTFVQLDNDASTYIREWMAFSADKFPMHEMAILGLAFAALAAGFKPRIMTTLFLLFLLHLFFTHARFVMFLFLLGPLVIMRDLAAQFPALASSKSSAPAVDGRSLVMIGAAAAAVSTLSLTVRDYTPRAKFNPAAGVEAARQYGVTGNVLNAYNFGGALILEGIPTFIDGRADRLYNGFIPQIKATQEADGAPLLREQIEKYAIGWAIMPPDDARAHHFKSFADWREIHSDKVSIVFVKTGG